MKKYFYIFILFILVTSITFSQNVWINEFSYDCADSSDGSNDGDEFIEIVAPVGTDMSNYGIVFFFKQDESYYAAFYSQLSGLVSSTNASYGKGFFIVKTAYSQRLELYRPIPIGITTNILYQAELFNDVSGVAIVTASAGEVLHAVVYELQAGERLPETVLTEKIIEAPGDLILTEINLLNKTVDAIRLPLSDLETSTPKGSISMIGSGFSRLWTTTLGDAPTNNSTPGQLNYNQNALPVELNSFSANVFDDRIKLVWRTETEVNNYGFDVERKTESTTWTKVNFVNGYGNSNSPKDYNYNDYSVKTGKYYYRLKQIDNDGQFAYSNIIEVSFNQVSEFTLSQNYPNPFNPNTNISFILPESGNVKITIYTLLGQEIKILLNGFIESGPHTVSFNAKDLNSGVYLYKLEANNFTQTRKMTFIK